MPAVYIDRSISLPDKVCVPVASNMSNFVNHVRILHLVYDNTCDFLSMI